MVQYGPLLSRSEVLSRFEHIGIPTILMRCAGGEAAGRNSVSFPVYDREAIGVEVGV